MTTPNQLPPDGAFVIGDPTTNTYGQGFDDQTAAAHMLSPFTLLTNPLGVIDMLADTLLALPLEVLNLFAPMIPGIEIFETVAQGVAAIMDFFTTLTPMLLGTFTAFLTNDLPALILAPLQALLDLLVAFLSPFPIIGDVIADMASAFGVMNENTDAAQETANNASSEIQALKATLDAGTSGAKIIDTFDRALASDLGAAWEQTYDGGSGTYGTDGNGVAEWDTGGSADRQCDCRHLTPLTSNVQIIRVIFDDKMSHQNNTDPSFSIYGRCDSTRQNRVLAFIDYNSCEIGVAVSGVYTRLGSAVSITSKAGDLWELRLGRVDGTEDYEFVLLQNNQPRVTETDSGHSSVMGGSNLFTGVIPKCGLFNNFGALQQRRPSNIQVFTATDNTP